MPACICFSSCCWCFPQFFHLKSWGMEFLWNSSRPQSNDFIHSKGFTSHRDRGHRNLLRVRRCCPLKQRVNSWGSEMARSTTGSNTYISQHSSWEFSKLILSHSFISLTKVSENNLYVFFSFVFLRAVELFVLIWQSGPNSKIPVVSPVVFPRSLPAPRGAREIGGGSPGAVLEGPWCKSVP